MFIEKLFEERYKDFNSYIYDKSYEIDEDKYRKNEFVSKILDFAQNPFKNRYKNPEDFICDLYKNELYVNRNGIYRLFNISGYESSKIRSS